MQTKRQELVRQWTEKYGLDVWSANRDSITFLVGDSAWTSLQKELSTVDEVHKGDPSLQTAESYLILKCSETIKI